MSEMTEACPECDEADLEWVKHSTTGRTAGHANDYRCDSCGHTFDEQDVVKRRSRVGEMRRQRLLRDTDLDEVLE